MKQRLKYLEENTIEITILFYVSLFVWSSKLWRPRHYYRCRDWSPHHQRLRLLLLLLLPLQEEPVEVRRVGPSKARTVWVMVINWKRRVNRNLDYIMLLTQGIDIIGKIKTAKQACISDRSCYVVQCQFVPEVSTEFSLSFPPHWIHATSIKPLHPVSRL